MNLLDAKGAWLARLFLERGVALICLVAFLVALNQWKGLLGDNGLLPVRLFIRQLPFRESPSLLYFWPGDAAAIAFACTGVGLSLLALTGLSERSHWSHAGVWLAIYLLYLSFVNVGQTFYAFGWESILLECCFLMIFIGSSRTVPQAIPMWLFRWLLFRILFGAGLIKLRGDQCWRNLTCLDYFYETQPMPNALSWYLHWSPRWFLRAGVLFNHFAEVIVPFAFFLPQPFAGIAGLISIVFQLTIIMGGNLSWLNWLTLILAFSLLDARFFAGLRSWIPGTLAEAPAPSQWANYILLAFVALMSIPVVTNMLSARQIMNTNFNSFHLVGSYGAFGSITKTRYEVVIEGTGDRQLSPQTEWREYHFKAKPGALGVIPPQIAPYHLRIDWLMWFAAMSSYQDYPWFVNLVAKLLSNNQAVLSLLRSNPFPNTPPHFIRAQLYEYHFTTPTEHSQTGLWWKRSLTGAYFPPVALDDRRFQQLLRLEGWLNPAS